MKVFETRQIREIDAYTIQHEPVSSHELMERAASGCVTWFCSNYPRNAGIRIFCGPGNNGGDGWAIARLLADKGYTQVTLYLLQISGILSPDSEINRGMLIRQGKVPVSEITRETDFPVIPQGDIVVDALFGSGLSRPLDGLPALLVKYINASGCPVVSIDIPSGLQGDDNTGIPDDCIIRANTTLTFEFPKRSFFFAENERFTGEWHIIPIGLHPAAKESLTTDFHYTTEDDIRHFFRKRKKFSHKGNYGHALLIAGSYGMAGAAILAARACLRSGVGLLTTHVPGNCYPIIQGVVPESIFSLDASGDHFSGVPALDGFSAVGAGPGIGTSAPSLEALRILIETCDKPLVLDADALNLMALQPGMIEHLPLNTVITPHPGEFDRLTGTSSSGFSRNKMQIEMAKKYGIIVLLKGAFSSVALPDGRCYYNSTGNPGMATAGSGDVLTGIILSLLAQGFSAEQATLAGCFIHGLTGDMAVRNRGQQSLISSDLIDYLSHAFNSLENHDTPI